MILAVIFQHSNSFIHKSISIFSRYKHPNTDSLLAVVDGFQLGIYLEISCGISALKQIIHSHSIVPGGLEVMS
jgi:hypothetical protein